MEAHSNVRGMSPSVSSTMDQSSNRFSIIRNKFKDWVVSVVSGIKAHISNSLNSIKTRIKSIKGYFVSTLTAKSSLPPKKPNLLGSAPGVHENHTPPVQSQNSNDLTGSCSIISDTFSSTDSGREQPGFSNGSLPEDPYTSQSVDDQFHSTEVPPEETEVGQVDDNRGRAPSITSLAGETNAGLSQQVENTFMEDSTELQSGHRTEHLITDPLTSKTADSGKLSTDDESECDEGEVVTSDQMKKDTKNKGIDQVNLEELEAKIPFIEVTFCDTSNSFNEPKKPIQGSPKNIELPMMVSGGQELSLSADELSEILGQNKQFRNPSIFGRTLNRNESRSTKNSVIDTTVNETEVRGLTCSRSESSSIIFSQSNNDDEYTLGSSPSNDCGENKSTHKLVGMDNSEEARENELQNQNMNTDPIDLSDSYKKNKNLFVQDGQVSTIENATDSNQLPDKGEEQKIANTSQGKYEQVSGQDDTCITPKCIEMHYMNPETLSEKECVNTPISEEFGQVHGNSGKEDLINTAQNESSEDENFVVIELDANDCSDGEVNSSITSKKSVMKGAKDQPERKPDGQSWFTACRLIYRKALLTGK